MLSINSVPEIEVHFSHIDEWFEKKFEKIAPPILATLMNVAAQHKINQVAFVALAIVKSKLFNSESSANNNYFDLREFPIGDKEAELVKYSTVYTGAVVAAKLLQRHKAFDEVTEQYYNSILEYVKTSKIVHIPRPDGTYPKAEEPVNQPPSDLPPAPIEPNKEPKVKEPINKPKLRQYFFIASALATVLGTASFFVPQLKPVSMIIKAIIDALKMIYGGN